MKKQKSLKLNFIMNVILTMSSFIFPLITFPYVSRVLSPVGTGKVSFANSVVSYFVILAQLGIPTYGIRACAKVRDDRQKLTKVVQELFIIGFIMCMISYVIFAIGLFTVPRLRVDKTLMIIISSSILFYTIGVEWLYKAMEQYAYITTRSIFFKFIALIAMFLFVHKQEDYVIYGAISIFAASASNIFNFFYMKKFIDIKPVGNYSLKKHLKPIMVFFAMSCATTIYVHLDSVMLGFMKTDADVGYYNVAIKTKMILVSVVTSLGTVLLPRVSYYVEHRMMTEFQQVTKKAMNFVSLLVYPLTLYFMLFAKESVYLLAGNQYDGAIMPMIVIMLTLPFIGMTNIMGIQVLVPMGKEKSVMYSEIAGAVVDLIINLILIPKMASTGAAIGTLAAEIVVWIVQYAALKDTIKPAYKAIRFPLIILALILGTAASLWVKTLHLSSFVTLAISAVLFFGVYALVLTIAKEKLVLEIENQVLGKVLRKKK